MTTYPRTLGRAFADDEVVLNYRHRPSYPAEVFDVLAGLLVAPRVVLDAGCGTGALTLGLARFADRVDALDSSEAMLREARRLSGGDTRIRWIGGRAEDAPLSPPYGLIIAGASVHWMDPAVVMPRFRSALAPDAYLAIVDAEWVHPDEPWRKDLLAAVRRYSPIHHGDFAAIVKSLEDSCHFRRRGEHRCAPVAFEQSSDDYLAMLASTSSLSRATLGRRRDSFESEARAVFAGHGVERVRFDVAAAIVWGEPLG